MPKKKVAKPTKKLVVKKAVTKASKVLKPKVSKSSQKKAAKPAAKTSSATANASKKTRPAERASAKSPVSVAGSTSSNGEVSLGRPLVTQEEKLYMLFHDDYQARQVFEFLRVENVKELEEFSPQQIVHMMSKPLRTTVDRIRQRLAQYKRSLKDDEQFAADFLKKAE